MHSPGPLGPAGDQMDFFASASSNALGASPLHVEAERSAESEDSSPVDERSRPTGSARTDDHQLTLGLPALPLNDYEWSDREICALLDGALVAQLRLLADERTSPELRRELIAWVAAPLKRMAEVVATPFSFQACCCAAGVDPEEMREQILRRFAPALLAELD